MSLPLDIIEIILSKLSVKPLIRFKSVCKPWNIMISDPVFVRNLHQRSKNSNSENLFLCHSTLNGLSVIKIEDRKFKTLQNIKCPYGRGRWRLCSSEGVMLLPTDGTFRRFALWNPTTRAHARLQHRRSCRMASFGLCRDPITDDFRVVIVNSDYYSVYSCNSESWMMLEKEYEIEHTGIGLQNRAGVCVDGASYWVRTRHNLSAQIVSYDPRDDKFKIVRKPENVDGSKSIYLVDLRGSLCMYSKGRNETRVQIWTKENGIDNHSWKELMTVVNVNMHLLSFQPLCLVGNKIVIQINHDKLVCYSPSEKRFEEFEEDTRPVSGLLIPYMESLFFPLRNLRHKRRRKQKCLQL